MRLQLREIINGRRLVTTENQEWGQRWLPGEAAGTVFRGCAQLTAISKQLTLNQ